jgi:hypothetical protein
VTGRIIGCAFRVANALGHGFIEKVYENLIAFGRSQVEIRRVTSAFACSFVQA